MHFSVYCDNVLTKKCKLTLEKISPGVYHIYKEMYATQVLVTSELPLEENLYLHCMRKSITDNSLVNRLANDYGCHSDQEIYVHYMNLITRANIHSEGGSPMVCEGILNLCGTSSKEIEEKTKEADAKIYLPQIKKLTEEIATLKARLAMYENN